ncbi:MAG: DEAD/DEAH box helicase, partial [Bacteroidetes bacterium]|nr:DEAD/DEAH box helicase [Bacteroidota bacterium]
MKFDEYHIAEGIKRSIGNLGYKKPTDIQFKAIPHILNGEDVLAIAHTGTGKTAAFVIPVLHILQQEINKTRQLGVKCLVMAPTHELAQQIDTVFKTIGKHTRIKTLCILGGVDQDPQKETLEKGVDVVIATPGRLFDLVSQGSLVLSRIQILILDEADHMLDLGFIKDIRDLMKHLPKRRQTLFFSATINDKIKKLAYSLVNNAIRIQISPKDPVAKNIEHGVAFIDMDDKRFFLADVINNNADKKILVFVRTKVRAERVKAAMERVNIETETIHSDV